MMGTDELVRRLGPMRLPADFADFGPPDALATLAVGLLLGLLLDQVLRLVTARRRSSVEIARLEIARLSRLAPEQRLVGLATLLERLDPKRSISRPAGLPHALYAPEVAFDPAPLESAIFHAARGRRS